MDNEKVKKLVGTGIVAAGITAVGAVSHAVTKELVKIAVDRDYSHKVPSRTKAQFKGSEDNVAFTTAVKEAAAELESRDKVTVEIMAADGERLVGHWFSCENAKRIVIAMHGWRASWSSNFGLIADFFHDNGCSVLYVEQRGQGNSGGVYMGLGALERLDCLDWIDWVIATVGPEIPIYLTGVSMGASTVLMATGLDLPDSVHGIIADCGFTSPHEISKHIVENNLHISFGHRGDVADEICRKKNQVGIKACSAVDALRDNEIPVLFIHGANDHFVPVEMTYENFEACEAPKELLIVPGADHAMSYYVDRQRYESYVMDFWRKYD